MIHTFKAVGQPMLLDVGSGAVHAIDDMAFDVLEMWNDHTPEEIRDALKEKYTAQELDEVIGELKQLEELGALNAPDNYDDVKQVTEPADMYVTERGSGKAVRKYEDSKQQCGDGIQPSGNKIFLQTVYDHGGGSIQKSCRGNFYKIRGNGRGRLPDQYAGI